MYQQLNIFDAQNQPISESLAMQDADVVIYRHLFNQEESNELFSELNSNINWKQEYIQMYGKSIPIPRKTAWYGDSGKSYTYSGIAMNPESWIPTLLKIKSKIEKLAEVNFNSVLLNLYRDGQDGVAWHSDDEPELGKNPVIGSVSFGGTRRFMFRRKDLKEGSKVELELTHGSFLIMRGTTQKFWQHQVPKTSKVVQPRINLTFRVIM